MAALRSKAFKLFCVVSPNVFGRFMFSPVLWRNALLFLVFDKHFIEEKISLLIS